MGAELAPTGDGRRRGREHLLKKGIGCDSFGAARLGVCSCTGFTDGKPGRQSSAQQQRPQRQTRGRRQAFVASD